MVEANKHKLMAGRLIARYVAILGAIAITTLPSASSRPIKHAAFAKIPSVILWAWERPEDLLWLPMGVGVAYLDTTIELSNIDANIRRRKHPLSVPSYAPVIPVVHVDISNRFPPVLTNEQHKTIVDSVISAAKMGNSNVVQLDFEVRRSQRDFFFKTVSSIRERLPSDYALSVTALASWCAGDYWLDRLEADEVVPMAFRMGKDSNVIRTLLDEKGSFIKRRCQDAIGYHINEPPTWSVSSRQYLFSSRPWTKSSWELFSVRTNL